MTLNEAIDILWDILQSPDCNFTDDERYAMRYVLALIEQRLPIPERD
ncbi:hypothetical protein ES703_120034 [subsurface metagenome]